MTYPEIASEAKSRQRERSYIDVIPTTIRLSYINASGKGMYKELQISGGRWDDYYVERLIELIETEHKLPLRRKEK